MKTITKLIGSENITLEEIQRITGYDPEGSIREYLHIIKSLGTGSTDLMVSQYCQFNGLDENEITEFLNQFRKEETRFEEFEPFISQAEIEAIEFIETFNQRPILI